MRGTTDEASFVTGAEYVVDGGDTAVWQAGADWEVINYSGTKHSFTGFGAVFLPDAQAKGDPSFPRWQRLALQYRGPRALDAKEPRLGAVASLIKARTGLLNCSSPSEPCQ
jgi:hypothetical protein